MNDTLLSFPVKLVTLALTLMVLAAPGRAKDVVEAKINDQQQTLTGRIIVEAQDGGLLLEAEDGHQWLVQAEEVIARSTTAEPFEPLSADALAESLQRELGSSFDVHQTTHYVIAFDTSSAFAFWVGALYERLYRGFHSYWRQRKIELKEPEFPLTIVIFGNQDRYREYATRDLGGDPGGIVAYYQMLSNRVVLYDITGVEAATDGQQRVRNAEQINRLLSQPAAAAMVATIVHEATHQIAYNAGLQQRLADIPMWLNEGLAMFFETPDLRSRSGWRGIGGVNPIRMPRFQELLLARNPASLGETLTNDDRFRDANDALDAYAEAWALVYYLAKVRRSEFADYLSELSTQTPLVEGTAEDRLALFRKHFGEDLNDFDEKFVRYMSRVK